MTELREVEPGGEYEPQINEDGTTTDTVKLVEVPSAPEPADEPNETWRIKLPGEPGAEAVDPVEHEDPDPENESEVPF